MGDKEMIRIFIINKRGKVKSSLFDKEKVFQSPKVFISCEVMNFFVLDGLIIH